MPPCHPPAPGVHSAKRMATAAMAAQSSPTAGPGESTNRRSAAFFPKDISSTAAAAPRPTRPGEHAAERNGRDERTAVGDGSAELDDFASIHAANATASNWDLDTAAEVASDDKEIEETLIDGVSHDETLLHWAVTGAFHTALWHILHYFGPALSPSELWVWRTLLQLSQRIKPSDARGGGADLVGENGVTGKDREASTILWKCSDGVELLLRLSLRKPSCFTVKSLESAYDELLNVGETLRALQEMELLHWHDNGTAVTVPASSSSCMTGVKSNSDAVGDVSHSCRVLAMQLDEGTNRGGCVTVPALPLLPEEVLRTFSQRPRRRKRGGGDDGEGDGARRKRDRTETVASAMVTRHSGLRIASLITRLTPRPAQRPSTGEKNASARAENAADYFSFSSAADALRERQTRHRLSPAQRKSMERELVQVMHAARGVDLRACATALHRCCTAYHYQQQQQQRQQQAPIHSTATEAALAKPAAELLKEGSDSLKTLIPSPLSSTRAARQDGYSGASGDWNETARLAVASGNVSVEGYKDERGESEEVADNNAIGNATAGVPSRKRELMLYFIERRYLQVATSAACSRDRNAAPDVVLAEITEEQEERLVARCWASFIGDCISVEPAVKSAVLSVAELFQLLTGNFGAGGVLTTMQQQTVAPAFVASAPTTLLARQQLRLLASFTSHEMCGESAGSTRFVNNATSPTVNTAVTTATSANAAKMHLHISAPLWWWRRWCCVIRKQQLRHSVHDTLSQPFVVPTPTGTASFEGDPGARVLLFHSAFDLAEYRRALTAHRTLFDVTLGASTIAQKLRAKNATFVHLLYDTVTKELAALQRESTRRARDQIYAASYRGATQPLEEGNDTLPNVHSVLARHGLRAQHLLQFTAKYRWYACLELLYPLLQSLHFYAEANTCLTYLLEVPVYTIYPPCKGETEGHHRAGEVPKAVVPPPLPSVNFPVYYRPQKRGEWLHRLAQNSIHLKQKEKALSMLEKAHDRWCAAFDSLKKDPSLRMALVTVLDKCAATNDPSNGTHHCGGGGGGDGTAATAVRTTDQGMPGKAEQATLLEGLPAAVQRRARLLRVIWPEREDSSRFPLSIYHACAEFQLDTYLRRADALCIEKTLRSLHLMLRKWTPLPPRHTRLTDSLWDVKRLYIKGMRDAMDWQMWHEPTLRKGGAMVVEAFVMEHLLRSANAKASAASIKHRVTHELRDEAGEEREAEAANDDEKDGGAKAVWEGLHCEGAWIAYAARVLLWDCYHYPLATLSTDAVGAATASHDDGAAASVTGELKDATGEYLWLTPFQDGPLDLLASVEFTARRRRLIESRLAFFEQNPKFALLKYAAEHMRGKEAPLQDAGDCFFGLPHVDNESSLSRTALTTAGVMAGVSKTVETKAVLENDESNPVVFVSDSELSTVTVQDHCVSAFNMNAPTPTRPKNDSDASFTDGCTAGQKCTILAGSGVAVPPELKVYVGDFPLLDILTAVPKAPLLRLLRCLYLGDLAEGYSVGFSGFPDLLLWRRGPSNPLAAANTAAAADTSVNLNVQSNDGVGGNDSEAAKAPTADTQGFSSDSFRLVEVKSPHDSLSAKQIEVNDCLRRCGFDISVAHVVDVEAEKQQEERLLAKKQRSKNATNR